MNYKERVIQGVKCCIQQKKKCNECPFYNQCDKLREEVLHALSLSLISMRTGQGFKKGFKNEEV